MDIVFGDFINGIPSNSDLIIIDGNSSEVVRSTWPSIETSGHQRTFCPFIEGFDSNIMFGVVSEACWLINMFFESLRFDFLSLQEVFWACDIHNIIFGTFNLTPFDNESIRRNFFSSWNI